MEKLTKEQILKRECGLTIGELKKFLEENKDLPDDSPILVERVEDKYFSNNGWGVYLKEGDFYNQTKNFNENMLKEIELRKKGEESEYESIEDPNKYITELTDDLKVQYFPTWCCVRYNDEDNILFIDCHY